MLHALHLLEMKTTVGVVVISEVALSRDVFLSEYNWYHLP